MLKMKDLLEKVENNTQKEMVKQIDIANLTKCLAQWSGIELKELQDERVEEYILIWAKSKEKYFSLLGNKLRFDTPFNFEDTTRDYEDRWEMFCRKYPQYLGFIREMIPMRDNKIDSQRFDWGTRDRFDKMLPKNWRDMKITHFFKECLNATDKQVTAIAAIYENTIVKATYTLSIDPVDIMLASETPYNWKSCYRLETDGYSDSHADGCVAAMLDTNSMIVYLWNEEGNYKLYRNYELKNIRYKIMRQWVSLSPSMKAVHFNVIYPYKYREDDELSKKMRIVLEDKIFEYLKTEDMLLENTWKKNKQDWDSELNKYIGFRCNRKREYGYSEFSSDYIWHLKDSKDEKWEAYDIDVPCLCCGCSLTGSQEYDDYEYEYNGEGFICGNFVEKEGGYCPYTDEWCEDGDCCCEHCCRGCSYWDDAHPVCDLDQEECNCDYDVYNGIAHSHEDHCVNCPHWINCHEEEEEEEEE